MPTYKDAGVDRDKADRLVEELADHVRRTEKETSRNLYRGFGDFAASYDLSGYDRPVIVSSCDGVGTKFLLQQRYDALESAGVDLVAMNVNDVLTTGAEPLLFLDYVAMSPLEAATVDSLVRGMSRACSEVDCLLAGGETAELPGMLEEDEVELAGFCVGAAEREFLTGSDSVVADQVIAGLPSMGIHANGFSLVRTVLDDHPDQFSDEDVESLLTPTRLYGEEVQSVVEADIVPSAMVHVTGGGLRGNLSRVLPGDLGASLCLPEWERSVVKTLLEHVPLAEAVRTFNMGFGWLFVVDEDEFGLLRKVVPECVQLGRVTGEASIDIRYDEVTV